MIGWLDIRFASRWSGGECTFPCFYCNRRMNSENENHSAFKGNHFTLHFPKKKKTFWTQVKSATHRTSERTAAHEFDILMMVVWALLEPSPGRPAAHLVFLCCDTAKVYQSFPQGRMPVNYINFSHPSFWYCVSTTEGLCLNFKSVLWIIWAFPPKLSQHMSRIWRIPSSR